MVLDTVQAQDRARNRAFEQEMKPSAFFGEEEDAVEWKSNAAAYLSDYHQARKWNEIVVASTGSSKRRKGEFMYASKVP